MQQTLYQYRPWLEDDDLSNVLFCSTHLYASLKEDEATFFPGTGDQNGNQLNFTTIILFYIENTPEESDIYPGGILNVPITPG